MKKPSDGLPEELPEQDLANQKVFFHWGEKTLRHEKTL
jgi:hypothetical protein